MNPLLSVEQVAALLCTSKRSVHEMTRLGQIPHRRVAGRRRCLFVPEELEAWLQGAPLDLVELEGGGRVVRPAYSPRTPRADSQRKSDARGEGGIRDPTF